jgi:hypothetical protein
LNTMRGQMRNMLRICQPLVGRDLHQHLSGARDFGETAA